MHITRALKISDNAIVKFIKSAEWSRNYWYWNPLSENVRNARKQLVCRKPERIVLALGLLLEVTENVGRIMFQNNIRSPKD
jgi:hypothetical protein